MFNLVVINPNDGIIKVEKCPEKKNKKKTLAS